MNAHDQCFSHKNTSEHLNKNNNQLIKKIKDAFFIRKYDFHPEIKSGHIDKIDTVVFYAIDGIGDLMIASPIMRDIFKRCHGKIYFCCSPSSAIYVNILKKTFKNIIIIPFPKNDVMKESDIDYVASTIKKKETVVDVIVNTEGRISPYFAKFAYLIKPRAVLTCVEGKKRISKNKMTHASTYYANLLFRKRVTYVDCWGMLTQMIGGTYERKNLFPEQRKCPVDVPYIALSLSGNTHGTITVENAIALCTMISRYYDGKLYILSSPGVEGLCRTVSSNVENVFVPVEPPSLETTALYIKHAQALISVCSAPVHIAGAFNTPVMVISSLYAPHWFPIVDHWDIYVTSGGSINNFDHDEFEDKFVKFITEIK